MHTASCSGQSLGCCHCQIITSDGHGEVSPPTCRGCPSVSARPGPRSSNAIPEPTTRSFTVEDTSTSRGPAIAATRAPIWTATPRTCSPASSTSPVCRPLRNSRPRPGTVSAGAPDRQGRPVEGRQETVAGGVHLPAAEVVQFPADQDVMPVEQVTPAVVPGLGGPFGCGAPDAAARWRPPGRSRAPASSRTPSSRVRRSLPRTG